MRGYKIRCRGDTSEASTTGPELLIDETGVLQSYNRGARKIISDQPAQSLRKVIHFAKLSVHIILNKKKIPCVIQGIFLFSEGNPGAIVTVEEMEGVERHHHLLIHHERTTLQEEDSVLLIRHYSTYL